MRRRRLLLFFLLFLLLGTAPFRRLHKKFGPQGCCQPPVDAQPRELRVSSAAWTGDTKFPDTYQSWEASFTRARPPVLFSAKPPSNSSGPATLPRRSS